MKINKIEVRNYRNLDELEVCFNDDINFIVGDNNVGKTNLLELIANISNANRFVDTDFFSQTQPIEIKIKLSLSEIECGTFDLLCDADEANVITLIVKQNTPDDNIECFHLPTGKPINTSKLRLINSSYYSSTRNPKQELVFNKKSGAAKFLGFLLNKHKKDNNIDEYGLIDSSIIEKIVLSLSSTLNKITAVCNNGIKIDVEKDGANILSNLLSFVDSNSIKLSESGNGVQYIMMIYLSLLENIMNLCEKENRIILNEGVKSCATIQIYDEPEVHLNPFLQKSTIAYLIEIIRKSDGEFTDLLKSIFGIDDFNVQVIIATHSESMIGDAYEKIIRMYSVEGKVKALTGKDICIDDKTKNQLSIQFKYFKEALFAKKVLVVEGYSELGALPLFAKKTGLDFDKASISVINAMSADSVASIMKLFDGFNFINYGIRDSDGCYSSVGNLTSTAELDFEAELISKILNAEKQVQIEKIITAFGGSGIETVIQKTAINKRISKYKLQIPDFTNDVKISQIDYVKRKEATAVLLTWFTLNKGLILGKIIADILSIDLIPQCYIDVINNLR